MFMGNVIVQQTELELISQMAASSANYRQFIRIYLQTTINPLTF